MIVQQKGKIILKKYRLWERVKEITKIERGCKKIMGIG